MASSTEDLSSTEQCVGKDNNAPPVDEGDPIEKMKTSSSQASVCSSTDNCCPICPACGHRLSANDIAGLGKHFFGQQQEKKVSQPADENLNIVDSSPQATVQQLGETKIASSPVKKSFPQRWPGEYRSYVVPPPNRTVYDAPDAELCLPQDYYYDYDYDYDEPCRSVKSNGFCNPFAKIAFSARHADKTASGRTGNVKQDQHRQLLAAGSSNGSVQCCKAARGCGRLVDDGLFPPDHNGHLMHDSSLWDETGATSSCSTTTPVCQKSTDNNRSWNFGMPHFFHKVLGIGKSERKNVNSLTHTHAYIYVSSSK
ncbi:Omega-hexatoxin-Asp2b [Trichinella pseudospiralis]